MDVLEPPNKLGLPHGARGIEVEGLTIQFLAFDDGTKIGVGIKTTDRFGQARLYWIKVRDLTRFAAAFERHLMDALSIHAIPRSRYSEYPMLVP
jgi:hypothetical protein